MIDLHCHILHGLDDGAESAAESMQMARTFVQTGYHIVAATPHMVPGTAWMPSIERISTRIADLNLIIADEGLALEIVPGMEIAIDPQLPELLDEGRLLPLGNASCLLIEPSFQQFPPGWKQIIFEIMARGYSILIAHPERCVQLAANSGLIDQLIESGVYLQVSWGSFLGQYGRKAARTAQILAGNGLIHCLATDSHHPEGHVPARIQVATTKLNKIIGQENLLRISTENPLRILKGQTPLPMTRTATMAGRSKKRWWRFWS